MFLPYQKERCWHVATLERFLRTATVEKLGSLKKFLYETEDDECREFICYLLSLEAQASLQLFSVSQGAISQTFPKLH